MTTSNMNLLAHFKEYIAKENLFAPTEQLLIAVSGGVDSIVLCELCRQARYDFVMAHCNFQLRGAESEREEHFVINLGKKYDKQVLVKRFATEEYALERKISIQVAARELRYEWFLSKLDGQKSVAESQSQAAADGGPGLPTVLLTAHHLDDNIETMLMNFFKGTGIAGLRGILPLQGRIARPLLFAKKDTLKAFAAEEHLQWVEDGSNQSDKYARNYFRNQLIPLVNSIYPEATQNLAQNLDRFKEIELLYRQSIDLHKKKLLEPKGNEVHIPVLKLQRTVPLPSVVYEIIKDYSFSAEQVCGIIDLLKSETGRYVQSATHRVIKNRNWLIISPTIAAAADTIPVTEPGVVAFATGRIELRIVPNTAALVSTLPAIACLDADLVNFPFLLRRWKTGDYFYPLGMRKKKKLGRFFIDQKLSKTAKEKTWVLEMNKKIIWVVGHRIDDRFKITAATKNILQITSETVDV